ncbi:MAG: hypothetical protein AB7S41_17865 [Parvibaculaceae bacterium]
MQAIDRHALVMTIWLSFGLVAASLFEYGFGAGGVFFVLAGFVVVLAAFAGHVIVNVVHRTTFTPRELALGLVIYAAALVSFGLATLLAPGFAARNFLPLSLGFLALFAVVVFYMVTHFGVRRVFDAFDVIRDFRPQGSAEPPSRDGGSR